MDETGYQVEDNLQGKKRSRNDDSTSDVKEIQGQNIKKVKQEQEKPTAQKLKDSSVSQLAFRPRTVRIAAKEAFQIHKSEHHKNQSPKKQQITQKQSLTLNVDNEQQKINVLQENENIYSSRNKQTDVEMNVDNDTKITNNDTNNLEKLQIKQTNEDVDIDMNNNDEKIQQEKQHKTQQKNNTQTTEKNVNNSKQSQNQQQTQKKSQQHVFQYGNYPNYYNIRRNTESFLDPRVIQFRQKWFQGKSVLDVGCHQGRIGLQIARLFSISKYVGVDIDPVLIAKAVGSLNHFRRVIRDKLKNAIIEKKKEEQRLGIIFQQQTQEKNLQDNQQLDENSKQAGISVQQTKEKNQQENKKLGESSGQGEISSQQTKEKNYQENQKLGESSFQAELNQNLQQKNFNNNNNKNLQRMDNQGEIGDLGVQEKFMENLEEKKDEKHDEDKMEVDISEKNIELTEQKMDMASHQKNQTQTSNLNQSKLQSEIQTSKLQENLNDTGAENYQTLEDPVNSEDIQVLKNAAHGLDNFKFINSDFMDFEVSENEKFDVILCLSVMKWIHFHHGDEGVKNLFYYLGEIIKQNGILLLEYQELSTYRTDIKKCRGYLKFDKMDEFKFTPDQFVPFLFNEVGFEEVEIMQIQTENKNNFQRNVYVLRKK